MRDLLKTYCLKNIWCNPTVDKQYFIRLTRMTKHGGDRGYTTVGLARYPLPDKENFYHIYMLGGNYPRNFNLLPTELNKWYRLDEYATYSGTLIQLYTGTGLFLSRFLSYVRITTNGTILIAVKPQLKIVDLNYKSIGVRFYTNAYFGSEESYTDEEYLHVEGAVASSSGSLVDLQTKFYNYRSLPGHAYLLHNGEYVTDIKPSMVSEGDIVELIHDSSVDNICDYPMKDAYSFLSILDSVRKYLIHPPKSYATRINYWDDVTFVFGRKEKDGVFRGRHLLNWDGKRIRMVSHNDYAITVSVLVNMVEENINWVGSPLNGFTLRIIYRKCGLERPLVDVHERLLELYKLNDTMIKRVLIGQQSAPVEWRCDELEKGNYTKMMRKLYSSIDNDLVINTLGYNAMAKITADSPLKVVVRPKAKYINVGYLTTANSTMYEYNVRGELLGVYQHNDGSSYHTKNDATTLVEAIASVAHHSPEYYLDQDNIYLNPSSGYRFYCKLKTSNTWEDVTDKGAHYTISNGFLKWGINRQVYNTLIVGNFYHLYNKFTLSPVNRVYSFDITIEKGNSKLPVPMGRVEVFVNGHALVQYIDYNVVWPKVYITNVEYLNDKAEQLIEYRVTGHCNSDLSMRDFSQIGFIRHSYISLNNRYDVRENKVVQIIVGGKVVDRTQVFSDEEGGATYVDENGNEQILISSYIKDGQPYQITDTDVPLRDIEDYKTDILKARSVDMDSRVSDFMTVYKPQIQLPNPITVEAWYRVYSPLIATLLGDIDSGKLKVPADEGDDSVFVDALKPYLYLLDYEPTLKGFTSDNVVLYPHGSIRQRQVTPQTYSFISRVNDGYLNSSMAVNKCLTIVK